MKDLSIVIPTVNLTNINRSPQSTSLPCSPSSSRGQPSAPFEYDGCMLCTNGTPSCLQKRRATWTLKLRVALYCLSVLHPDKKYFNLKKDIYTYVDNHWDLLSINTAKSDRWRKQVQDSLSHCRHFESGWDAMGCNGHWRLIQPLNPWSFPPEKEAGIIDEESDFSSYNTPESSLSPRPSKSPREDPLYRNFPKRRVPTTPTAMSMSQSGLNGGGEEDMDSRKRKADELPTEEELIMLKYSPMIYSNDTPSPKCRTPRNNNPAITTSPSIIGSSPMMTSGNYFSLTNFSTNLTLSGGQLSDRSHYQPQQYVPQQPTLNMSNSNVNQQAPQVNATLLDTTNNAPVPVVGTSPSSSPNLSSSFKSSPPIPSIPFSWRNNSSNSTPLPVAPTTNSCSFSPLKTSSPITFLGDTSATAERLPTPREVKINTLPNPFVSDRSSNLNASSVDIKFTSPTFFSNNSSLKVPSELLKVSGGSVGGSTSPSNQHTNNVSSSPTPSSGANSPANVAAVGLTKLQQQNLILNCTY